MTLDVSIEHRLSDAFRVDAQFSSAGPVMALFGPSGAGKTTLVNAIAGLIRPQRGRIAVDGEAIVDTARNLFTPTHRRRVGYVFQEGRLFPHLTVRQNLLFGRWFSRSGATESSQPSLGDVVDLLGIGHLLARRPGALSGGEKQRVAIGRALLSHPRLLLMDEPLASLDDARKAEILPYIERLRDEARTPIVYVSHSLAEVARLATQVVVLSQGQVADIVTPSELVGRSDLAPEFAAELGALLMARVASRDDAFGLAVLRTDAGDLHAPWRPELLVGADVRVRIRARDVMLATKRPDSVSALNALQGIVRAIQPTATDAIVDVAVDCAGELIMARLTRKAVANLALRPGAQVFVVVKSVTFDGHALGGATSSRVAEVASAS